MHPHILAPWTFQTKKPSHSIIVPDGCRDLIYRHIAGSRPFWMISSLFDSTTIINQSQPTLFIGYRLKPGTSILADRLLAKLKDCDPDPQMVAIRIDQYTTLTTSTKDCLAALSRHSISILQTAKDLGVTIRTLQRHIVKTTQRTPTYWQSLARIRQCARQITNCQNLSDLAAQSGYADQSHMTREFRRWLGTSPTQFRQRLDLQKQLTETGYDAS